MIKSAVKGFAFGYAFVIIVAVLLCIVGAFM